MDDGKENWDVKTDSFLIQSKKRLSLVVTPDKVIFINKVGEIAEKESHHPDLSLGFGYCLVMIHTHAIKGLAESDFILAAKIDKAS